jgi:hypothetical protein
VLFSVNKLKLSKAKHKSDVYLFMTTTRNFHLICLLALVLGLSACGTTGNPSARAHSTKPLGANEVPAKNSMGKTELASILQVPVISITELTKPTTTQTQKCIAKADDTKPVVGGAISDSQGCVNFSSTEIVKVFKVVYELSGSQYAVELPENPGPYIQLQITATPSQNSSTSDGVTVVGEAPAAVVYQHAAIAPALAYPYVFYSGAFYRPVPIFIGARYRYGGGYRMVRGRRH